MEITQNFNLCFLPNLHVSYDPKNPKRKILLMPSDCYHFVNMIVAVKTKIKLKFGICDFFAPYSELDEKSLRKLEYKDKNICMCWVLRAIVKLFRRTT